MKTRYTHENILRWLDADAAKAKAGHGETAYKLGVAIYHLTNLLNGGNDAKWSKKYIPKQLKNPQSE